MGKIKERKEGEKDAKGKKSQEGKREKTLRKKEGKKINGKAKGNVALEAKAWWVVSFLPPVSPLLITFPFFLSPRASALYYNTKLRWSFDIIYQVHTVNFFSCPQWSLGTR